MLSLITSVKKKKYIKKYKALHLNWCKLTNSVQIKNLLWKLWRLIKYHDMYFLIFIYLFWKRERVRACKQERGRDREQERENPKEASYWQQRARHGARSHQPELALNSEIMTWAEIKSQALKWLSHPRASTTCTY